MAEVAANLIERVLPPVPVRQWVLSVPWALRLHGLRSPPVPSVARAFLRAVSASYRRSAKEQGLSSSAPTRKDRVPKLCAPKHRVPLRAPRAPRARAR